MNDSISSIKESIDSPWHGLSIKIRKISLLDTPNQLLIRSRNLGNCVYDTFKHFWQTNKYNETGWLLPMSLDKVGE